MKVKIYPSNVNGTIKIPSSKSMSHRAIICASLAQGTSKITNISYSDDVKITIEGMRTLGASITCFEDYVIVEGIQNFTSLQNTNVFCNESGSTLRFFIPIFSLCNQKITFTGKNRLLKRPQSIYEDLWNKQNLYYKQDEDKIEIEGKLKPGTIELDGNISSQFISGLLFTLPLLEEDSILKIREPFESRSYVDLTLQMLSIYGIKAEYRDRNTIFISGNQKYQPQSYDIEGDFSQLAFFAVLASINNDLTITGLNPASLQGDKQILSILEKAGAKIIQNNNGYTIYKSDLKGCDIDLSNCPDLGPILNVLGMYAKGITRIYNAQRLRYKESDRIAAMEEELLACGVDIKTSEDEIIISGKDMYESTRNLYSHKDHRIVMSLSVAATLFNKPIIIEGAQAIQKSYPAFFEDLKSIGVKVEYYD